MTYRILAAVAVLALTAAGGASAGERSACRQSSGADNPMVSSSDFGVATCNTRHTPRYHRDDYDGPTHRAASDDPMVWDTDQWRSDLMGGYPHSSDDGYDRRFHQDDARSSGGYATTVVNVEIEQDDAAAPVRRKEPVLFVAGVRRPWMGSRPRAVLDWRDRTRCGQGGLKILLWEGGRSVEVCPATGVWRGRLAPPVKDSSSGDRG